VIGYEIIVLDPEPEQFTRVAQTDVNVLFERRVAMVNTQSQDRSRKKWRIDTASACAGATGWPHRWYALEKYRSDDKKFVRTFFLTALALWDGILYTAQRQRQAPKGAPRKKEEKKVT
jgi:hypothetical protein